MIRILVVDDHPVVLEGMSAILTSEPDFEVVGEASSADDAVAAARRLDPDVIVLDFKLPGRSGTDVCAAFVKEQIRARTLIVTSFPSQSAIVAAFSAGAAGFAAKESEPSLLVEAVRTVAAGGTFVDPRVAGKLVAAATAGRRAVGPFGLTAAEMRVLELLPGRTNFDISRELRLSEASVDAHLRGAMRKLGVHDRAEAVAAARREGLA